MTYDLKVRENLPCWAGNEKNCKVLKRCIKKDCLTCNFYKTIRDHELDQERTMKRLKSLDKATRLAIAEKYGVEGIVDENDKKIRAVVEEARKILNDYPHLKYYQAIIKAKEVFKQNDKIKKA